MVKKSAEKKPVAVIPEEMLRRFVGLADQMAKLKVAEKEYDSLHGELKNLYAGGATAPDGWAIAVQESTRVIVKWREIARALWVQLEMDADIAEARVKADTEPQHFHSLVVNKR